MKRFLPTVVSPLIAWTILSVSWQMPATAGTSFGVNRIRYVEATGTPEENCQSLRDTLSSITDNSFANPYLVQLEPGVYSCGTQFLGVGGGIALVGSGTGHTTISGGVDNNFLGVIHLWDTGSILRDLAVVNVVSSAEQKSIGVSINTILSGGPVVSIELRDVGVFAHDLAVLANNASIEVWSSRFTGSPAQHDSSTVPKKKAFFYYSILPGVQGTGAHHCRFSGTETGDFGLACEHPDTN